MAALDSEPRTSRLQRPCRWNRWMLSLYSRGCLPLESGESVSWMTDYGRGWSSQAGQALNWLVAERYQGRRGKGGIDGTDPAISVLVSGPYGCPPSPDSLWPWSGLLPLKRSFLQLQVAFLWTQLSQKGKWPVSGPDQASSLCVTSIVWVEYYRGKKKS